MKRLYEISKSIRKIHFFSDYDNLDIFGLSVQKMESYLWNRLEKFQCRRRNTDRTEIMSMRQLARECCGSMARIVIFDSTDYDYDDYEDCATYNLDYIFNIKSNSILQTAISSARIYRFRIQKGDNYVCKTITNHSSIIG